MSVITLLCFLFSSRIPYIPSSKHNKVRRTTHYYPRPYHPTKTYCRGQCPYTSNQLTGTTSGPTDDTEIQIARTFTYSGLKGQMSWMYCVPVSQHCTGLPTGPRPYPTTQSGLIAGTFVYMLDQPVSMMLIQLTSTGPRYA